MRIVTQARVRLAGVAGILSFVALAACDGSGRAANAPELDHGRLDVVELTGEVLNQDPIIGRPFGLALSGDVLWVREGSGEPFLHAIDARSGRILESVGRNGAGPGEFDGAPLVLSANDRDPGSVWAFDLTLRRFTLVHPDRVPEGDSPVVRLEGTPRVVKAVWLPTNEFVGVTEFTQARFVRFDSTGARIAQVPGALLGDASEPEAERREATITSFTICPHPAGGFAVAYGTAGRVELYDASAQLIDTASVPYPSQPLFRLDEDTRRSKFIIDRQWYIDCEATDSHVYALFSGRDPRVFRRGEASTGQFLHVFSWDDGQLERVLRLDPPLGSIAVDPAGTTLYGASFLTAGIYRFRMPSMP